jgi:hypothetical protein
MKANVSCQSVLKAQILEACGIKILCIADCREISMQIFNKDKNYLSETTIQRFLGLIDSTDLPSPFVLDSLAKFAGYTGWDQFKKNSCDKKYQTF